MRRRQWEVIAVVAVLLVAARSAVSFDAAPQRHEIPSVVGKPFAAARETLARPGFSPVLGSVRNRTAPVESCKVERQRPAPFSPGRRGTQVVLDLDCRFVDPPA